MNSSRRQFLRWALLGLLPCLPRLLPACAQEGKPLPNTAPLEWSGDLSARMLDGVHRFLDREIAASVTNRGRFWRRDTASPEAYEASVQTNRERLARILGMVDTRLPARLEKWGDDTSGPLVAETSGYRVYQVRWDVLEGVTAEGLLLEPNTPAVANIVALPDADQTPEEISGLAGGAPKGSQFARVLAEHGCRVLAPVLISRASDFSGNPDILWTDQPHREWIHRQAYHMGRHIVGYEIQKVLAAVDWFKQGPQKGQKTGVIGYGEGGLVTLLAAALDRRVDACVCSGYFGPREGLWSEPIYRNVWGLLREFGDAEIATLVAPRGLIVEHSPFPAAKPPGVAAAGRKACAAPGAIVTPDFGAVRGEFERIGRILPAGFGARELVSNGSQPAPFGSPKSIDLLLRLLTDGKPPVPAADNLVRTTRLPEARLRQRRQVRELENHVQRLLANADTTRNDFFLHALKPGYKTKPWTKALRVPTDSPGEFAEAARPYRDIFRKELLGQIEQPLLPANPRSRQVYDREKWVGHEVVLDVFPDVFAWGILLVPKDIKPGERRPVVVCQHGRNGLPKEVVEGNTDYYHDFAARLAERGFVTFAPHNLYRNEARYRGIARKANSVKLSMFSFIVEQHRQILDWLGQLPYVDSNRIGFYGLSYGGETAVRVPTVLEGYALSICSGDFNDWGRKVASINSRYSFMFTDESEMPYFNMGSTFNYLEAAALMIPRPFMVERGHHDGVAPDEWVASEYAKVRWLYDQMGLSDKTEIEFFPGGHTINGQGTFRFLTKHLLR